jgi:4-hydroxybenzoate-CoA ligase
VSPVCWRDASPRGSSKSDRIGGAVQHDFNERRPYNAVSDFVDANVARGLGRKVAFIDPDRSLSYDDLQTRSIRFANALRSLGVEHEQRVALLLNDTVDYPVAFWGVIRAGAIAIPLNTYLPLPQYAYILGDCRATTLVVAAPLAQSLSSIIDELPRLKNVVVVDGQSDATQVHSRKTVHVFEDLSPAPIRHRSLPTRCRTRLRSGSTRLVRPVTPRASSMSIPI